MPNWLFAALRSVYLKFPESVRPRLKKSFFWLLIRLKAAVSLRRVYSAKRIEFLHFEIAHLEACEFLGPRSEEILVETVCSLVSPGTEQAILCGLPGVRHRFPYAPGYSASGKLVAVGKLVNQFKVGDRVAGMIHHTSRETVLPDLVFRVPDGVSYEEASFVMLGIIALQGVRKARIVPGDRVAIVGQGLIGQLVNRLACLCGASSIVAVAASRKRATLALQAGADEFVSTSEGIDRLNSIQADAVIEATGAPQAITLACRCAREKGRVSIVGSSRGLAREVDAWGLLQKKMLTVIGAHSSTMPKEDPSQTRWTYRQEGRLFFELLQTGRLKISDLITWRAKPADCNAVYEVLTEGGSAQVGILFNWQPERSFV